MPDTNVNVVNTNVTIVADIFNSLSDEVKAAEVTVTIGLMPEN